MSAALSVAAVVAGTLLLVAPASAAVTHPFLSSFDGTETPAGSFAEAGGVAVDASSGDVYVADLANQVVDKFSSAGAYLCQITGAGSATTSPSECDESAPGAPGGAFSFTKPTRTSTPTVAVDNSGGANGGDLYVADSDKGVIDRFDSSGKYLSQITGPFSGSLNGVAVDASGNVWVHDSSEKVSEFNPSGNQVFQFNSGEDSSSFAVDSNENTYVKSAPGATKFDSAGHKLGPFDECTFCQRGLAVDLSTDEVYVYEGNTFTVPGHEPHVREYGPANELLAEFGKAQLASGEDGGIAVDPVSGTIYVSNAIDAKVYVFGPNLGPRVVPAAASEVTATELTAHASVNPEGAQLGECRFEYGTDTSYGQSAPCVPASVPPDSTYHPVEAKLTGLTPGTIYHFRLAAANANGGPTQSADRHAVTLPAPVIDEAKAIEVEPTSATLTAKINPKGNDSHYHFEYDTVEYKEGEAPHGTSVPVPDEDIGNATSDVEVSQPIEELSPGTTYHWRVLAANHCNSAEPAEECTTASVDHTFVYLSPEQQSCPQNEALRTANGSLALPDCRAYEQVSPTDKNGALIGDIFIFGAPPTPSSDGSRLTAPSINCFADAASCYAHYVGIGSPFAFARTPAGWQASALSPPASEPQFAITSLNLAADPETGAALFSSPNPLTGEDDLFRRAADGSFTEIGPVTPPSAGALGPREGAGATPDVSHVIWNSNHGADWPFDATTGTDSLYEYAGTANSQPFLVGVTGGQGSTDLISVCGTQFGGKSTGAPGDISPDGRTVFFFAEGGPGCFGTGANSATPVPANALYARIDGGLPSAHTVAISERSPTDCTGACLTSAPADAAFEGASKDGALAYFTSTQQLTDSATQDSDNLYLYDFNRPAGEELIDVTAGDPSPAGPRLRRVLAVSADGSHAYFTAKGLLTPDPNSQGQHPQDGANNLYAYDADSGDTAFIATLGADDAPASTNSVTPDGRFLVFTSNAPLTPDATSQSGAQQVFRYDATEEQLIRISIGERGFNDNGNRSTPTACSGGNFGCLEDAHLAQTQGQVRRDPTMSDDGSYVFFSSPVALTPGALDDVLVGTNGNGDPIYAQNIYEWHAGHVSLISDGADASQTAGTAFGCPSSSSVCLLGVDSSGQNVFFSTTDPITPSDTDTQLDFYDARVGGGFAPPPAPTPCQGDACKGPGTEEGPKASPATPGFSGPEEGPNNPQKPKCKTGFVKKRGNCVKQHSKKHHSKHHKRHAKRANANRRAGK